MALNYKKNTEVIFDKNKKPVDFELVTISKWRYKNYQKDELVYVNRINDTYIYRCLLDHKSNIYNLNGGKFTETVNNTKYWELISGNATKPQSAKLNGTVYTLVLSDNTTISTDLKPIDTYLNEVDYQDGILTFKNNKGVELTTVNISSLSGATDTYVSGGTLQGSNLNLVKNNGDILPPIDLSSLVANDVYLVSGEYFDDNIILKMSDGSEIKIDVTPLVIDTNTFVDSGEIVDDRLILNLNNGTSIYIDISSISDNTYVDNGTYNKLTKLLTLERNDGTTFNVNLSDLANQDDVITNVNIVGNNLVLTYSDGDTIEVNISDLLANNFVVSGNYDGQNLILHRNDGNNVSISMPIDSIVSGVTGDTYVVSGEVINDDLVLTYNNGSSINIDCSDFTEDRYVSSANLSGNDLNLVLNNGSVVSVDLSGLDTGDFIELNDTPNSYNGSGGSLLRVKLDESGIEFHSISGNVATTNYIVISDNAFSSGSTSLYEVDVDNSYLQGDENIIIINVTGATGSTDNYFINLPSIPNSLYEAKKMKIICKSFNMLDTNYGLFFTTPWVSGGTINRILSKDTKTEFTNAGYYYPLEVLEGLEMIFDGSDWLVMNNIKNQYVAINAI